MEFVTSFRVKAEPNKVYDLAETHFQSLGWNIEMGNKPRELAMNRGTGWGTFASHDIKRVQLKLNVSIFDTNGEVTVKCQYIGSSSRGYYTEQEKSDLNAEVNTLKNMISITAFTHIPQDPQPIQIPQPQALSGALCPSCNKSVSPDFAMCPYCGSKLGKPTCASCHKEIGADFKMCPYCGTPR